ncbi:hypothetical protein VKT23_020439 [Stygiomarasmius scandens]|uniref:Fungal-type protein kinase domain-containing protein n=1 Tax=Marasmiellus scandens TaxID=2682957 RepID=A0ABR1IMP2_9AGAR
MAGSVLTNNSTPEWRHILESLQYDQNTPASLKSTLTTQSVGSLTLFRLHNPIPAEAEGMAQLQHQKILDDVLSGRYQILNTTRRPLDIQLNCAVWQYCIVRESSGIDTVTMKSTPSTLRRVLEDIYTVRIDSQEDRDKSIVVDRIATRLEIPPNIPTGPVEKLRKTLKRKRWISDKVKDSFAFKLAKEVVSAQDWESMYDESPIPPIEPDLFPETPAMPPCSSDELDALYHVHTYHQQIHNFHDQAISKSPSLLTTHFCELFTSPPFALEASDRWKWAYHQEELNGVKVIYAVRGKPDETRSLSPKSDFSLTLKNGTFSLLIAEVDSNLDADQDKWQMLVQSVILARISHWSRSDCQVICSVFVSRAFNAQFFYTHFDEQTAYIQSERYNLGKVDNALELFRLFYNLRDHSLTLEGLDSVKRHQIRNRGG